MQDMILPSLSPCTSIIPVDVVLALCVATQLNTLRPRQDVRHFPDDIFKSIFLNENIRISIKISLKFVPKCSINNVPALVQIMAWRRPGDKPLSESMMVSLSTHICVTRTQWINAFPVTYRYKGPLMGKCVLRRFQHGVILQPLKLSIVN